MAVAEHLALLLLPGVIRATGLAPTPGVVHDAAERSYSIIDGLHRAEVAASIDAGNKRLDESVAGRFRISGLTLRNPGVPEHWAELLRVFAQDFDPGIERWSPFSLGDALAIMKALQLGHMERYGVWYARLHETAERAWSAYREHRLPIDAHGTDFSALFAQIDTERLRPKKTIVEHVEASGLGDIDTVSFIDCDDVSSRTGIPRDTVTAFLAHFSVSTDIKEDFLILPSARDALTRTPVIATDRGFFGAVSSASTMGYSASDRRFA